MQRCWLSMHRACVASLYTLTVQEEVSHLLSVLIRRLSAIKEWFMKRIVKQRALGVSVESRECRKCGATKALSLFAKNKNCQQGRERVCQECRTKVVTEKRRGAKVRSVEYLGGACMHCGGVFHPAVYDFHHTDPTVKEADPGSLMGRKWERIAEELDKCVLLCANCHRMEHNIPEVYQ